MQKASSSASCQLVFTFSLFFFWCLFRFFVCLIRVPPPPAPRLCSPPTTAPSAPPQEVHLVSLTSTSLKVSWLAPPADSRHGAIVLYTVSYQALAGEDTERHDVPNIGADATSYVLEGLEKWTEYQVWVRAHTDVGPGPESDPVTMRTKEDGRCTPRRDSGLRRLSAQSRLSLSLLTVSCFFLGVLLINSELMRRYWYRAGTTPLLLFFSSFQLALYRFTTLHLWRVKAHQA